MAENLDTNWNDPGDEYGKAGSLGYKSSNTSNETAWKSLLDTTTDQSNFDQFTPKFQVWLKEHLSELVERAVQRVAENEFLKNTVEQNGIKQVAEIGGLKLSATNKSTNLGIYTKGIFYQLVEDSMYTGVESNYVTKVGKNFNVNAGGHINMKAEGNSASEIKGDTYKVTHGNTRTRTYGDFHTFVRGDTTRFTRGKVHNKTKGNLINEVYGNNFVTIHGSTTGSYAGAVTNSIAGISTTTIAGVAMTTLLGGRVTTVGGINVNVIGAITENFHYGPVYSQTIGTVNAFQAGLKTDVLAGNTIKFVSGNDSQVIVGMAFKIVGAKHDLNFSEFKSTTVKSGVQVIDTFVSTLQTGDNVLYLKRSALNVFF